MNTLVSYDWLKEYVNLKGMTPDEFAKRVSLSGPGVEKIIPQGTGLEKIVVGYVREVKSHPNADKLRLAVVDVGSIHDGPLQIVCGGSNLKSDQWVVVALIGSKVRWHGEGDLVELQPAEIRGVKSEGMICAANEVGLFDAFPHAEREILDLGEAMGWSVAKGVKNRLPTLGVPIADVLELSSDVVMDIEVTSNRVDAMGMVGMAREAAAILNKPFTWKVPKSLEKKGTKKQLVSVKVSAKKLCPRYMAVRIDGVQVGPSPWWVKRRLRSAGLNSINNIVDVTNLVMLELAQPLHAFDATKVEKSIEVRLARAGEKIQTLDGREHELTDSMLVIADAVKPIAIAGVIGGQASGVSASTTSIILEAATFDPVSIRRTARTLNIQTDAQLRYEKGLSVQALPDALSRAVTLMRELTGGEVVSLVTDIRANTYVQKAFSISTQEITDLIGVALPQKEVVAILKRLGFVVSVQGKTLKAKVPWWRDHDIEMARDFVEEVARVYGYANIPSVVPVGLAPRPMASELVWEDRIREISKGAGLIETYSYSFVAKDLLEKAGYDTRYMLKVQNPLAADLEIMRTTLLPSLLQIASENRERESVLRLFEVANVYYPSEALSLAKGEVEGGASWRDLPEERLEIGALFTGMQQPWKIAKGYVEHVLDECGMHNVSWRRLANDSFWHPGRTVQAFVKGDLIATVGEISPSIAERFKFDQPVALVDMPILNIVKYATFAKQYQPLSVFPAAKRDVAVIVDRRTEYDDLARELRRVDPLMTDVEWFDTFQGKGLPEGKKSVAMHLTFSSADRTLASSEVDALMERGILRLKEVFGAEIRS